MGTGNEMPLARYVTKNQMKQLIGDNLHCSMKKKTNELNILEEFRHRMLMEL